MRPGPLEPGEIVRCGTITTLPKFGTGATRLQFRHVIPNGRTRPSTWPERPGLQPLSYKTRWMDVVGMSQQTGGLFQQPVPWMQTMTGKLVAITTRMKCRSTSGTEEQGVKIVDGAVVVSRLVLDGSSGSRQVVAAAAASGGCHYERNPDRGTCSV